MKKPTSLRFEPILKAQCDAKAAEHGMTFSEWIRLIARQAISRRAKNRH